MSKTNLTSGLLAKLGFSPLKVACFCLALGLVAVSPQGLTAQQNIVNTAVNAKSFNTLVAAVKAAGLVDTLANQELTVFAPTDEAFAKLDPATLEFLLKPENKDALTAILTYHVVPGRVRARDAYPLRSANTVNGQRLPIALQEATPMIGNANLLKTDIECTNGVIHVIDTVLLPASNDIPTLAKNAGQFNTLLAAVGQAGLAEALSSAGPFTVFAPTDEAFAKLPADTIPTLLKPENKSQLVNILKYHVIPARVYAADAVKAQTATTLSGRSVKIGFSEQGISINDAKVVGANLDASNGVVHVIDSVLIPSPQLTPAETLTMLNGAVEKGAPVFNAGHHGQCCNIYMATLQKVKSTGVAGADAHTMSMIETALTNATNTHDTTQRAWVLRNCIDSVYTRMQTTMPMSIRQ